MSFSLARLVKDDRASSAAEFALVVPLLLLLMFGIIDVGRYMWTLNQLEKTTQMGVRYAVVSDPVTSVINADFVDEASIPGGDPVPTSAFGSATCDDTNCTSTGSVAGDRDAGAFTRIVDWMKRYYPLLTADKVEVIYQNVGLGYSGDPTGPDVAPLTTVAISGLQFQPMVLFGGTVNLPTVKASLTLEDGECSTTGDCASSN